MASECRVRFGQVVIGAPGSGKTTYCRAMQQFLAAQHRPALVVNLDPANDLPVCDVQQRQDGVSPLVDVTSLITVRQVMDQHQLGPNGALVHCMRFVADNLQFVLEQLRPYPDHYVLFDFPGQVELYTHDRSVPRIIKQLEEHNFRLVAVNLVDAHHCTDPGKFVSMVVTCLSSMLHLALPHINVLSKLDVAERHAPLLFGLDFYTDVLDLEQLVSAIDEHPFLARHRRLTAALAELVERYGLVSFQPLAVQDRRLLAQLCRRADMAGGCVFARAAGGGSGEGGGEAPRSVQSMLACAVGAESEHERVARASDSYIGQRQPGSHPSDSSRGPTGTPAAIRTELNN